MKFDHLYDRLACGAWRTLFAIVLVSIAATGSASGQRFQETLGGGNPNGEIGNAVIEAANGDIVTAGVSHSWTASPQAYVVRTDPHGNIIWHFTYDVDASGMSQANDIKEYPGGDFIVVGWTEQPPADRHAFAMRIDGGGNVVWTVKLTGSGTISEAASVVVAQQGDGITTFPEDIILCGHRQSTGGVQSVGLMARIDAGGAMVWKKAYNISATPGGLTARLYGVDETQIPSITGVAGDIVAVGASNDAPAGIPDELWVLRVDGNTGLITGAPHGSAFFGGVSDDRGYSIQELRSGANPGDLVVTGVSYSRPGPSTNSEIVAMQLLADPCDPASPRASEFLGDNGPFEDLGLCVREIRSPAVGTVGNVMIGGTTNNSTTGDFNALLQEFQEGTMTPVGSASFFGDFGDEDARMLAETPNAPNTPGYVFTGSSTSGVLTLGNPRNLYLVKTDGGLTTPCYNWQPALNNASTGWTPMCTGTRIADILITNSIATPFGTPSWGPWVPCYTPFKPVMPRDGDAKMWLSRRGE